MKKLINLIIIVLLVIGSLLIITTTLSSQNKNVILGKWVDEEEKSNFEIFRCSLKNSARNKKKDDISGGDYEKDEYSNKYCGQIVWLKDPYEDDDVTPKKDDKNIDTELRDREVLGLKFMWGFEFKEITWGNEYFYHNGKIYNPSDGKTYDCEMFYDPNKPNTLKVSGFVWIIFKFSKTQTWTRVKGNNEY